MGTKNDAKFVVLERFNSLSKAEIVKGLLESCGITCSLANETIQTVFPYLTSGVAPIKLLIPEDELEKAREILSAKVDKDDLKKEMEEAAPPKRKSKKG